MTAAFDYARTKATADRMLARYGQAGTLRRPTKSGTSYNPTVGSPTDYDAIFAVTKFDTKDIDGTRILSTDKKVLLAAGSTTVIPATTDLLVIGGVEHKIIDVQTLSPAGTAVLYTLQVRR